MTIITLTKTMKKIPSNHNVLIQYCSFQRLSSSVFFLVPFPFPLTRLVILNRECPSLPVDSPVLCFCRIPFLIHSFSFTISVTQSCSTIPLMFSCVAQNYLHSMVLLTCLLVGLQFLYVLLLFSLPPSVVKSDVISHLSVSFSVGTCLLLLSRLLHCYLRILYIAFLASFLLLLCILPSFPLTGS